MKIAIYHNPSCGTSRNALAMIRQSGEEPEVIEYLKTPPSRERLRELASAMGVPLRALLREKERVYAELNLADSRWSDDELIDAMLAHPILIQRPIVVSDKGVRMCRPSERVLDLLDKPMSFVKEGDEVVGRKK
jgi:arsenate reductase